MTKQFIALLSVIGFIVYVITWLVMDTIFDKPTNWVLMVTTGIVYEALGVWWFYRNFGMEDESNGDG